MIDKIEIGKRIYELRLERSLTQDEFAQQLEVKRSAISQIENGLIAPSLELANKISIKFSVPVDWIINGISNHFFKHFTPSSGYETKSTETYPSDSDPMLPSNEETIRFLKAIVNQKEIELVHSAQIIKYLEEKMQSNTIELDTLKKLISILEKQSQQNK